MRKRIPRTPRPPKPEQEKDIPSHAKCPWCGRDKVKMARGRYYPHLTPGGVRCVGIGQPYHRSWYNRPQ